MAPPTTITRKRYTIQQKMQLVHRVQQCKKEGMKTEAAAQANGVTIHCYYKWKQEIKKRKLQPEKMLRRLHFKSYNEGSRSGIQKHTDDILNFISEKRESGITVTTRLIVDFVSSIDANFQKKSDKAKMATILRFLKTNEFAFGPGNTVTRKGKKMVISVETNERVCDLGNESAKTDSFGDMTINAPSDAIKYECFDDKPSIEPLCSDSAGEAEDDEPIKSNEQEFEKGDKIEAKFRGRGNRWYKGTVASRLFNGTYNIIYDDGDKDLGLPPNAIRAVKNQASGSKRSRDGSLVLSEGTKVEARYRGRSKYHSGVIKKARSSGTFDIEYDDGKKELGVKPRLIRVVEDSADSSEEVDLSSSDPNNETRNREANSKKAPRRTDSESASEAEESASVSEEEITEDVEMLPEDLVLPQVGQDSCKKMNIVSRKGNKLYKGVISKVRVVHLYEIDYADGTKDVNIPFKALRAKEGLRASDIEVGDSVDVLSWQDRFFDQMKGAAF